MVLNKLYPLQNDHRQDLTRPAPSTVKSTSAKTEPESTSEAAVVEDVELEDEETLLANKNTFR